MISDRLVALSATARSLPASTNWRDEEMPPNIICTAPASRSFSPGAVPL
jgi:hypothetical protein